MSIEDEHRLAYLSLIQGAINRMSTSSAIFKGFASAILAGVVAISFTDVSWIVLMIMILPMLAFLLMDTLYLREERRYRMLYDAVRSKEHPIDYLLDAKAFANPNHKSEIVDCFKSWSIIYFYIPLFVAMLILIILRILGID